MRTLRCAESAGASFAVAFCLSLAGCSAAGDQDAQDATGQPPADASGALSPDAGGDSGGSPADAASDARTVDATADADAGLVDATLADANANASPDAGLTDATLADAATDSGRADADAAAAVVPDAARVCTSTSDTQSQACGVCGTQSRICRSQADGGIDWEGWSYCNGQRDGGCAPGTDPDGGVACGNRCGRSRAVCQNDCTFALGSCIVPANAVCDKGVAAWQAGLGCADAGDGRRHTCLGDCTWGTWSECELQYPVIEGGVAGAADIVVTAVGQTVSATRTFTAGAVMTKIPVSYFGSSCPLTGSFTSVASYPFVYTTIANNSAAPRVVAIWASIAAAGVDIDTVMAAYPVPVGPVSEADRRTCVGAANDDCATNTDGCNDSSGFSGLVGAEAITIPAGAIYTVIVQPYFAANGVGSFVVNAKAIN